MTTTPARHRSGEQTEWFTERFARVADNIETAVRGKRHFVELALTCLVAEGHLLIEDVPGVGKTSLARALAESLRASWRRIQFTPDLLPSDVTGISIYNQGTQTFDFHDGPIFSNLVVADEINRASPKTQSALLEVMEERQVTVEGRTRPVDPPFMVIATQNPVEMEGTYPLPEAQRDRFLMRLSVGYPDRSTEADLVLSRPATVADKLTPVLSLEEVRVMVALSKDVHLAPPLADYIVALTAATRDAEQVAVGVSPRGSLALARAARALALSRGRTYALPEDVQHLAGPVLAHRMILSPEAELRGTAVEEVLERVVRSVRVPVISGDR